jgi:hypothetical protein
MEMRVELASQETHFVSCPPRGEHRTIRSSPRDTAIFRSLAAKPTERVPSEGSFPRR